MAYTINFSGGQFTINDGTLNTSSTSLALPGRNYAGYGSPVNQSIVYMLEHFASATSTGPSMPVRGQIWYDTTTAKLKINVGTQVAPVWEQVWVGDDLSNLNLAGGNAGDFLSTDGNGNLYWTSAGGMPAGGLLGQVLVTIDNAGTAAWGSIDCSPSGGASNDF